jgi:hypothetical protein
MFQDKHDSLSVNAKPLKPGVGVFVATAAAFALVAVLRSGDPAETQTPPFTQYTDLECQSQFMRMAAQKGYDPTATVTAVVGSGNCVARYPAGSTVDSYVWRGESQHGL